MIEIILNLFVISGTAAVLAFFLEIAGSYLGDYGERHIIINDEKDLVVNGGRPLLASLMEENIFIPSACGGKGTCAYCKVKVHEGGGPILPTETPYLSREEVNENFRLSCQVKVKEDIKIEIPEELFLVKEFRVGVVNIETLTPDIKGISLDILSPPEGINFKPGQYVQLEVPKYERTKGPEYRAYSISSKSEQQHNIELAITRAPNGTVSTYVHDYLKEGEELIAHGPYGDFFIRESGREILLVATGSGLAPIRSMLHQIAAAHNQRKTTLFFGARTRSDLYYYEELRDLEHKIKDFTFVPTLSRPRDEDQWQGAQGRVTDLIEKLIPEQAPIDAYLCGSPEMVESCMDLLKTKGIPHENIYYDKFE